MLVKRWGKNKIVIFEIYVFIIYCCFSILLSLNTKQTLLAGDLGDGAYAIFSGLAKTIHNGELPLWYPYIWGGVSGFNAPLQSFYPITLILCWIYSDEFGVLSYEMISTYQAFHFLVLLNGLYLLFKILRFYPLTCFTVPILFASSIAGMQILHWPYLFSGFAWLPLQIALTCKLLNTEGNADERYLILILGLIVGLIGLSNPAHNLLMSGFIFALQFGFFIYYFKINRVSRYYCFNTLFRCNAIYGYLLGIGISSIALLPFVEYMTNAARFVPDIGWIRGFDKISINHFIADKVHVDDVNAMLNGSEVGKLPFNISLIFFFIIGLSILKKAENLLFAIFLFFLTLFYSIGIVFPYIFYYVPFLNGIREPFLYAPYVWLSCVIIAGYGFDCVAGMIIKKNYYNLNYSKLFLLLLILTVLVMVSCNFRLNIFITYLLLVFMVFIGLTKLRPRKKYKIFILTLFFVIVINQYSFFDQLKNIGKYSISDQVTKISIANNSIYNIYEKDTPTSKDPFRVISLSGPGLTGSYPSNGLAVLGFYDVLGYLNPLYYKLPLIIHQLDFAKRAELQNIKLIIHSSEPDNEKFSNWVAAHNYLNRRDVTGVFSSYDNNSPRKVTIYDAPLRHGSAWFVHKAIPYDKNIRNQDIVKLLNSTTSHPGKEALVDNITFNDSQLGNLVESESIVTDVNTYVNRSVYHVRTKSASLLVTADSDYPGWRVYIDGKPVKMLSVNYAFKGVLVPADANIVEFKYLPDSFLFGLGVFVFSFIFAIYFIRKPLC